jgi:hypothetical protein
LGADWLALEADVEDAQRAVLARRIQQWTGEEVEEMAEEEMVCAEERGDWPDLTEFEVD